ncbi:MAG TPA: hypothetical protein VG295_10125 [Solirubrobacteraceae bacterium]|jgi:hypothetical protein|nr:hypothetical protein [Solirubrobacteraceae bacterium]
MLHKHRAPGIDHRPAQTMKGFEHLTDAWVILMRWLAECKVEHVVVGPAGGAIRGDAGAEGPLAIVPAPYDRNLDRVAQALLAAHTRLRTADGAGATPVRFSAASLAAGEHWKLTCEIIYDLDVEMVPAPRYSELLYEANRVEVESGLTVEVASLETLEHGLHVPLADEEPEIRITRGPAVHQRSS